LNVANAQTQDTDRIIQQAKDTEKQAKQVEKDAKKGKKIEQSDTRIDIRETEPVVYPGANRVRVLSIVAAVASAIAIAAQATVAISQQTSKSKREKAGLEGAIRMTIAVTVAKAVPSILSEIRTIRREMQRK